MKKLLIASALLVATGTMALAAGQEPRLSTERPKADHGKAVTVKPQRTGRIVSKRGVVYSGIVVQPLTRDNPLQMFNPAAPEKYGSPDQNVSRDPKDGKVLGFKLFSIEF